MGMPFSSFCCLCRPRNWRPGLTARLGSGYSFPASTGEAGHWVGEPSELSAPRWAMPFDHLVKEGASGPAAGSLTPSFPHLPTVPWAPSLRRAWGWGHGRESGVPSWCLSWCRQCWVTGRARSALPVGAWRSWWGRCGSWREATESRGRGRGQGGDAGAGS